MLPSYFDIPNDEISLAALLKMCLFLTILLVSLSGCSTWDKFNKTEKGAVIGGGSGAVLGGAVGGTTGAVVGGAGGALAGGVIGHQVERDDRRDRNRY